MLHCVYLAFNIIIGGPPCVDYSKVNASRRGICGKQGQYTVRFAKLLDRIRMHPKQKGESLFFLCENVPLYGDDARDADEAFGISPICIDAKYFSPCKCNRTYFTSVSYYCANSLSW